MSKHQPVVHSAKDDKQNYGSAPAYNRDPGDPLPPTMTSAPDVRTATLNSDGHGATIQPSPGQAPLEARPLPTDTTVPPQPIPGAGLVSPNAPVLNEKVMVAVCNLAVQRIACRMYLGFNENDLSRTSNIDPWDSLDEATRSNWCAAAIAALPHLNQN